MALSHVVSELSNVENVVTSKSRSEVTQGHWNGHGSIRRLWLPINVP